MGWPCDLWLFGTQSEWLGLEGGIVRDCFWSTRYPRPVSPYGAHQADCLGRLAMRRGSVTAIRSAGVAGLCMNRCYHWWICVLIRVASPSHLAVDHDSVRHDPQPICLFFLWAFPLLGRCVKPVCRPGVLSVSVGLPTSEL